MSGWLILRVFAGHPFEIELTLQGLGFEAYCPRFTIKRRHAFSRRIQLDVIKPLFPGYLFVDKPFDTRLLNTSRLKTGLMARDGRYLTVSEREMERVREAERRAGTDWHPQINEIIGALADLVKSAGPKKFTNLAALQKKKVAA